MVVGQVMLHIPAKYQTRNLYGYGNFPPDMSKSGISAFGILNGRRAAILDRIDPIFSVKMGPMGIHPHTKFGLLCNFQVPWPILIV